ncbi:superoxide dismutase [Fe] [Volvox carteri f. nagariensis]|uniref:Superoxide dismutase n=1 Tax=Volvox carteri f. nagariensis TaxID=3068 RepID=D8TH83_VOLCA|nr:superoxide dismutase [Fe] [Volvox carteri f. nagariensis]EFJ53026.1 superoxide dismutase [Fe] [Volvox carteri f. nagariensis]|eukprot:XP_002946031.1 superoxide dismutase [Fe] [Volvox carteri f. nagariensis]
MALFMKVQASSLIAGLRRGRPVSGRRALVTMGKVELKAPPYPLDALEPHMSKRTLELHWGKHHRAHVDNLNKQIEGTPLAGKSLEEIFLNIYRGGAYRNNIPVFHNAAQAWNHTFFWESMKPNGGGAPTGMLAEAIARDFRGFDNFKAYFRHAGMNQFGSGWAWLNTNESGKLMIFNTPDAMNPLVETKLRPILTVDVWEHAYYIDFQNRREDYLNTFIEKLIDWDVVAKRYAAAQQ